MIKDLKVPQAGCGAARGPVRSALAAALITLCSASAAALPLVWRADWPDAKPVETLVHRGTDIELQPLWRINKQPADTNGWTFTTFCQTNAVGPWFGPMPGAFFSHTNDIGAAFYNVMVRAETPGGAVNYTAFARLRMLDSPGFTPGELPLPAKSIDFASVEVFNAPWTKEIESLSVAVESNRVDIASLTDTTSTLSDSISTLNDTKADRSELSYAISPTSPAFSNAVLSVGLGIDTNTVAVINELVDSAHDLPVTGATSVGALLLALAAAIAALKKRLPYALVEKAIENGAVTLDDRASNAVTISAALSPNTLTINFPAATSGKERDFALRLNIASGVTAPELVLPQGVVCENAAGGVPEISDGGTGGSSTILYFSETENNGTSAKFLLKGETLAAITQA